MSKRSVNHVSKIDIPGFAGCAFMDVQTLSNDSHTYTHTHTNIHTIQNE